LMVSLPFPPMFTSSVSVPKEPQLSCTVPQLSDVYRSPARLCLPVLSYSICFRFSSLRSSFF
jgi:hypothetical protein